MTALCIICNKSFLKKDKSSSHSNLCCSYNCLRKTGIVRKKFLITALKKRNINIEFEDNIDYLEKEYSKIMSSITKKSTNKKHNTIIEKHGNLHDFYVAAGVKSKESKINSFLIKNNIIPDLESVSKQQKIDLYNKNFNKITLHGDKIKKGRVDIFGTQEKFEENARKNSLKLACEYSGLTVDDTLSMTKEEIIKIYSKYLKFKKFSNTNPIKWKKTHLINAGIIDSNFDSEDDINKYYSEYLSKRCNSGILKYSNSGYKKSKKGWYFFINLDLKYFYRSSWELEVLKILDMLIKEKLIIQVFEPNRIKYCIDNKQKHYYPDIGVKLANSKEVILEIKPKSKLLDSINVAKFNAAKSTNINFKILTEEVIFSNNLRKILLGEIDE